MAYTGPSIIDYLKSVGQPSDFEYRSKLAAQKNISGYSGTADQNTSLLNMLRSPAPAPAPLPPPPQPAPVAPPPAPKPLAPAPTPPPSPIAPFVPIVQPFAPIIQPFIQPFIPKPAPAPTPAPAPAPVSAPFTPAPAPKPVAPPPAQPKTFPDPTPLSDSSIVNFLNAAKQPSDYASRNKLANLYGVQGYTGSPTQNTTLLTMLRNEYRQTGAIGAPAPRPGDQFAPKPPAPGVKPPVVPGQPPVVPPAGKPTSLSDPSIINFLNSLGLPSDFNSRAKLAKERGISGYTGSGPQNLRLLDILRKEQTAGTFGQLPGAKPPKQEEPPAPPKKPEEPQPSPENKQAEIDRLNQDANKDQKDEFSIIDDKTKGKVDLSTSEGLVQQLITLLGTQAQQQKDQPSMEQKFVTERKKLGVGELETSLNKADADLKKLDADYRSTTEEEEGRQVSMFQIRRRQGAHELAYNRLRRDLVAERDSVANQLNMKYGVLNSMVKYAGEDYDNAQQNYQFQWNAAIQMTNLIKGIEDNAKSDTERKEDNARANVQIMFNLIKSGNVSYDQLDESTKLDIKSMEIQAGFPVGFTKFVTETIDDPVIHFGSEFTDASGNRIQPITTVDKNTGNMSIKNINLGKAKPGGDKEPPSSYQEWQLAGGLKGTGKSYAEFIATKSGETEGEKSQKARSGIVAFFNKKKGKDGYISPKDFKEARNAWAADGYSDDDFLKGFKNWANPEHYGDYDNSYF